MNSNTCQADKKINFIRVSIPNHAKARALTPEGYYDFSRGNVGELAHNNWVFCRIFMLGLKNQYTQVYNAFKNTNPFLELGWTVKDTCPTSSIYRWTYADKPMFDYLHNMECYAMHFECLKSPPTEFVQYISGLCNTPTILTWTKGMYDKYVYFNFKNK
tara:strand:+ start:53 stop:529 length:477 start_codon:yes stop_codon:yes gene_type:complete